MRRYLIVLVLLAAAIAGAQNIDYQPDPGWQPPAEAAARQNPLAARPQFAAGGAKLFRVVRRSNRWHHGAIPSEGDRDDGPRAATQKKRPHGRVDRSPGEVARPLHSDPHSSMAA